MATEAQLMEALKAADAAGNVDDAKQLAQLIQAKRTSAQPAEQPSSKGPSPLRRAEAALRGVTSGALGLGDYAAAAGDLLGGNVIRPLVGKQSLPGGVGASLDRVREERRALEKEAPVASAVGNVAGALVPISRVGSILKKGQPIANTAKTAAISALEGGVTEANLGGDAGDVATAAGVSGLAGPVVGAAARGAGGVVNFGRSFFDKNIDEGTRILAKKLSQKGGDRVNPADLQAKAAEFRRVTGRAPTVMDLVGAQGAEDVLNTTFRGSEASGILADAAAKRATALQEDLARNLSRDPSNKLSVPGVSARNAQRSAAARDANVAAKEAEKLALRTAKENVSSARSIAVQTLSERRSEVAKSILGAKKAATEAEKKAAERFSKAVSELPTFRGSLTPESAAADLKHFGDDYWKANARTTVSLSDADIRSLLKKDVRRFLPENVSRSLSSAKKEAVDNDLPLRGEISLRDLDNLRIDLRRAGRKSGKSARYRAVADKVTAITTKKAPHYANYLEGYAARAQYLEGTKAANTVSSSKKADRFEDFAANASEDTIVGFRKASTRVFQQISESPRRAAKFAEAIADDNDMFRRLSLAVGGDSAVALRASAQKYVREKELAKALPIAEREAQTKALSDLTKTLGDSISRAQADLVAVPRAKLAVDRSKTRGATRLREAVDAGSSILGARTSDMQYLAENFVPAQKKVASAVARRALADTARQSPEAAGKLARSLSEDAGLARKLGALDTKEAARLRELGTVESKSAETVGKIGVGAAANLSQDDAARALKSVIETGLSAGGAGSLSFKVSALTRVFQFFRVPPTSAKNLAEMLVDPDRVDEGIVKLRDAGVDLRTVEKAARAAAQVTARTAGPALTGEQ